MSYKRRTVRGLMGLGAAVVDDQAPIVVGTDAKNNPILSSASVMASAVMLKMAGVPKADRLNEMVRRLNGLKAGLGNASRADFLRRAAQSPSNKVDQGMFETLRDAIGGVLVERTLGQRGVSGLGQTIAEARGTTSTSVNDANAILCSYVTGSVGMVGGVLDQVGITGADLKRAVISLGTVLALYALFALAMVPPIEPRISRRAEDLAASTAADPRATDPFLAELRPLFPPDAWELRRAKILHSDGLSLLFENYKPRPDGSVHVFPCTVVVQREGQSSETDPAANSPLILAGTRRGRPATGSSTRPPQRSDRPTRRRAAAGTCEDPQCGRARWSGATEHRNGQRAD